MGAPLVMITALYDMRMIEKQMYDKIIDCGLGTIGFNYIASIIFQIVTWCGFIFLLR